MHVCVTLPCYVLNCLTSSLNPHHDHLRSKRGAKKKKRENAKTPHMGLWPFLKILNLGHINLCQWFENIFKLKRILFVSKKPKSNQRKIQNLATCDNGHF